MESFLLTFPAVALAELGDKTQLVVIFLAARFRKPWAVLAGLVVGAAANAGVAVAAGAALDRLVPPGFLEWLVAAGFLAIGGWILFGHACDTIVMTMTMATMPKRRRQAVTVHS